MVTINILENLLTYLLDHMIVREYSNNVFYYF